MLCLKLHPFVIVCSGSPTTSTSFDLFRQSSSIFFGIANHSHSLRSFLASIEDTILPKSVFVSYEFGQQIIVAQKACSESRQHESTLSVEWHPSRSGHNPFETCWRNQAEIQREIMTRTGLKLFSNPSWWAKALLHPWFLNTSGGFRIQMHHYRPSPSKSAEQDVVIAILSPTCSARAFSCSMSSSSKSSSSEAETESD